MKPNRSGNCLHCGIWRQVLHRDHIIPKHMGGGNEKANIQLICANCHQDKTALELRARNTGRRIPPETRAKMASANLGHAVLDETKEKIKHTLASVWTPEKRAEHGASRVGHAVSQETRAKISAALVGIPQRPEALAKRSATTKGRPGHPLSPETRAKIGASMRARRHQVEDAKI